MQQQAQRVLITGSNRGIGFGTLIAALKHAEEGTGPRYHLIMTSRDLQRGEAAVKELKDRFKDAHISLIQLDITCPISIQRAVQYLKKTGPLDVLINNAGTGIDDVDLTLAVYYYGTKQFTDLLLSNDLINPKGKIIALSGILPYVEELKEINQDAHSILSRQRTDLTFDELDRVVKNYRSDMYDQDSERQLQWMKSDETFPVIMFARIYFFLLSRSSHILDNHIQVYCTDPGWVKTGIYEGALHDDAPLTIEEGGENVYFLLNYREDLDMTCQGELFDENREVFYPK